ncbi:MULTISPECIES: hypothetical protein [Vibrio]|uniref:Uncharacterized protein n=3 Tax=Vibrio harveyi TaxID=669 RepID=A0A8B3D7C8_VIBHA|nr:MULTISPECIES: hypothetical protein [Vibrio]EKO3839542.1 hypothetical protein [Vibrio harveyi]EKO3869510.1 hypothetical protein [Vibrio harveyi]ELE7134537.1 hypothetical protein [Vibrio harveyi]ELI6427459.1 hypothetical protein [Vibrio harveyi]ELY1985220.1 hypothetical protein [Vibrio harveyi]
MKKCLIVSLLTLGFTAPGLASGWKNSSDLNIKGLYPADEGLYFYVTNESESSSTSTCDGDRRFLIPTSSQNYETKVSVMIAAFMASKSIRLRYEEEQSTDCSITVASFKVNL